MKKRELKNRIRRRTADKLYDRYRSSGRMPAHLPATHSSAIKPGIGRKKSASRKAQVTRPPAA